MSGGTFNYDQWHIQQIADQIEQTIIEAGRRITQTSDDNEYRRYSFEEMDEYYPKFNSKTLGIMKRAVYVLRMAYIYAQRVDWLLAGDDGEDNLEERLQMELSELKAKYPSGRFTYKTRKVKYDDECGRYRIINEQ